MVVVVTHESNVASYFFEEGNLSGGNTYLCSNVFGPSSSARAICLSFQIGQILRSCTISSTANTTGVHLGFERDYNYHTHFRGVLGHHA